MPAAMRRAEEPPHRRNRAAYTALLGDTHAAVFPLQWHLRLRLEGEPGFRDGEFEPAGGAPDPAQGLD